MGAVFLVSPGFGAHKKVHKDDPRHNNSTLRPPPVRDADFESVVVVNRPEASNQNSAPDARGVENKVRTCNNERERERERDATRNRGFTKV